MLKNEGLVSKMGAQIVFSINPTTRVSRGERREREQVRKGRGSDEDLTQPLNINAVLPGLGCSAPKSTGVGERPMELRGNFPSDLGSALSHNQTTALLPFRPRLCSF